MKPIQQILLSFPMNLCLHLNRKCHVYLSLFFSFLLILCSSYYLISTIRKHLIIIKKYTLCNIIAFIYFIFFLNFYIIIFIFSLILIFLFICTQRCFLTFYFRLFFKFHIKLYHFLLILNNSLLLFLNLILLKLLN